MSNMRTIFIKIIICISVGALLYHVALRYSARSSCPALTDSYCHEHKEKSIHATTGAVSDTQDAAQHPQAEQSTTPAPGTTNAASENKSYKGNISPESTPITASSIRVQENTEHPRITTQPVSPQKHARSLNADAASKRPSPVPAGPESNIPAPLTHNNIITNTQTRPITVTNDITKKMLGYSHWTGTHTPTFFGITVNGIPMNQGEQKKIDITDNQFTVSYRYSFRGGYKTGARNILFKIKPEATNAAITFSWKNSWHIICEQATPEAAEVIPFEQ